MRALDIEATMDAARAVAGFGDVGDAAEAMGRAVDDAADKAKASASRLDSVADSADNLDSKSAAATGALGALSSGFELVGAEKYAGGLQAAALATDFFSGVGQTANLIMQSSAVLKAKDAAASVAHGVATGAQAAATGVATAAQWAFNAAMSANPLALVVLAVVALVAIFVVLYRKSSTVRDGVRAVGEVGRRAIGWVVDVAKRLWGWFDDKLPSAIRLVSTVAKTYFRIATLPIRTLIDVTKNAYEWLHDKIPTAFGAVKSKAADIAEGMLRPFRTLLNIARDVLETLGLIEDKQRNGGMANGAQGAADYFTDNAPGSGNGPQRGDGNPRPRSVTNININGGLVDGRTVRQIETAQNNERRRNGR